MTVRRRSRPFSARRPPDAVVRPCFAWGCIAAQQARRRVLALREPLCAAGEGGAWQAALRKTLQWLASSTSWPEVGSASWRLSRLTSSGVVRSTTAASWPRWRHVAATGQLCGLRTEQPAPRQELSLHGQNLEKVELLGQVCRHLRILYLQNNVIGRIGKPLCTLFRAGD